MKGNFVLLRAGKLRLVVPQAQVGAAVYLDGEQDRAGFAAVGDDLKMLPECPPGRFIAAPFEGEAEGISWCWDELRVLIDAEFDPIELPDSILAKGAPVDSYVDVDGEPAFVCDAARACRYALGQAV